MFQWWRKWLSRWADEAARLTILDLQRKLEVERNAVAVLEEQVKLQAAVWACEHTRVLAVTAEYARKAATGG